MAHVDVMQVTSGPTHAAAVLRYEWTVSIKPSVGSAYPGMGFFSGGAREVWFPAGLLTYGVFTVPGMDSTTAFPLPDDSEYYFYVRVWLADKQFKIFRSDGVRVRGRGPQLKVSPRVLDGQLVQNPDYWLNSSVERPTNVSVRAYLDLEYQPQNLFVAASWQWSSLAGADGMFTSEEQVFYCYYGYYCYCGYYCYYG